MAESGEPPVSRPQILVIKKPSFPFVHLSFCSGLTTLCMLLPFPECRESIEPMGAKVDLEEISDEPGPLRRYDQELVSEDKAFEVNLRTANVNKSALSSAERVVETNRSWNKIIEWHRKLPAHESSTWTRDCTYKNACHIPNYSMCNKSPTDLEKQTWTSSAVSLAKVSIWTVPRSLKVSRKVGSWSFFPTKKSARKRKPCISYYTRTNLSILPWRSQKCGFAQIQRKTFDSATSAFYHSSSLPSETTFEMLTIIDIKCIEAGNRIQKENSGKFYVLDFVRISYCLNNLWWTGTTVIE